MKFKRNNSIQISLSIFIAGVLLIQLATSCGKTATSAAGLGVQYQIINLSPDLKSVNLYIDFKLVNTSPFVFTVNQGYFYLPSIDTPFQIRTSQVIDTNLFTRSDVLKTRDSVKYTLYIVGDVANKSVKQIFTVDTAIAPPLGKGEVRFVNASPSGAGGFDIYANGTIAFKKVLYPMYSNYVQLPVGNYNFDISAAGSTSILKTLPSVTVQDGKLYTIYTYGYTTRIDSAAFNAAVITNK